MRLRRRPSTPQAQPRLFACLDEQGICRAFHLSAQAPGAAHWHEVNEQRLAWLGKRLPASVFVQAERSAATA